MSLITARKKRTSLYLSVAGLMVMVAAVSAISARDPSGVSLRVGMIMVTVGAALWLPWRQLIPVVLLAWLVPNLGRSLVDDVTLGNLNMVLELPGLAGVGFFTWMARETLKRLEQENVLIGTGVSDLAGMNPETGIFDENQLRPAISSELARSRRFGRTFSLVLVGLDEMRQKFDYRDDAVWKASLDATTQLLRETRLNVDRVFHFKAGSFAILLPETTEKDIPGLVKRLRQLARSMKPAEGEPGGPMPVHFGATFFPDCATTVDDLLRRAEVALRIAGGNMTRYQLDSAEAPELPPVETLRRENVDATVVDSIATPTPPAISNPVAAAIVDEAYAERTREAGATEAEPAQEPATPVLESEQVAESVAVSEEPVEVRPVGMTQDVPEVEAPTLVTELESVEPVLAVVSEPEAPVAQPIELTPVAASVAQDDDFDALLKQMDETLKMIQSVRSHAA